VAIAGDIVIKLAADFAEFSTAMREGQQRLEEFGRKASETSGEIEGFIGKLSSMARAAGIVTAVAAVANEVAKRPRPPVAGGRPAGNTENPP
jgi:hypothetical protein